MEAGGINLKSVNGLKKIIDSPWKWSIGGFPIQISQMKITDNILKD